MDEKKIEESSNSKIEESSNSKNEEEKENWEFIYIDQQLIEWMTGPTSPFSVPRADNG